MPAYDKHLIGGLATFLVASIIIGTKNVSNATCIQWLFFCLFGSLFPDIDTKSHIQKWFYASAFLTICFLYFSGNSISPAWALLALPLFVRHRGLFHSPKFLLILSVGLAILFQLNGYQNNQDYRTLALFFLLGTYSHIILDIGLKKFFYKLTKK